MKEKAQRVKVEIGVKGVKSVARSDDLVIVVDVLRASSTIITAITNGALSILPTVRIGDARSLAKKVPNSLLGGERKGLRVPGFHFGNSPLEYTSELVRNKNIVFTTTNCTKVLEECKHLAPSNEVCIGAFLNITAMVRRAKEFLEEEKGCISIIQAGSGGKSSLDDLLCAESINVMIQNNDDQHLTSSMRKIMSQMSYVVLSDSRHGRHLSGIGFQEDLRYCSQVDTTNLVPKMEKGQGIITRIVASQAKP